MRICLMIEGQEDVRWSDWVALARACEEAGLEALFRSDHYLSVKAHEGRGSLDAWTVLAGLAAVTDRLRLGTLVSPVTFRHPSLLAKSVTTVDHISGGRAELGMGAGWFEPEHSAFGFPFPDDGTRFSMLAEQMEIVRRHWYQDTAAFEGEHYRIGDVDPLPKPVQDPHPNLIVGGLGKPRSARLAARWANEYNTLFASPDECRERKHWILEVWTREGRAPDELTYSLMTGCLIGRTEDEALERARWLMGFDGEEGSPGAYLSSLEPEWVVGDMERAAARLRELADAGVDRVMLQHRNHTDTDTVALLGELGRALG